jgi:hypothetical protein
MLTVTGIGIGTVALNPAAFNLAGCDSEMPRPGSLALPAALARPEGCAGPAPTQKLRLDSESEFKRRPAAGPGGRPP